MDLGENVTAANAHLIAAAPDLLAACIEADRLYSNYSLLAQAVEGEGLNVGKWIGACRDAIEKATNQTAAASSGGGKAGHAGNG